MFVCLMGLWFGGQLPLPLLLHNFVKLHSGSGILHRRMALPPSLRTQETGPSRTSVHSETFLSHDDMNARRIPSLPGFHGWRWPWWVSSATHTHSRESRPSGWAEGFETCLWSGYRGESNRGPWSRCGWRGQSPPSPWAAAGSADRGDIRSLNSSSLYSRNCQSSKLWNRIIRREMYMTTY